MLIYAAAFARSLGIGLFGVVLGIYLYRIGFSSLGIGLVLAAGLAGGALATLAVSLRADRVGRRRSLFALALLSSIGGVALAFGPSLTELLPLALIAMLNGMGTDRGAALALEQAIIPGLVPDRARTWALSWHNVLLDGGGALGALAGTLPVAIGHWSGATLTSGYRYVFLGIAALYVLSGGLYLLLSPRVEEAGAAAPSAAVTPETKKVIARLTRLFSLDAFGGGFLGDALVAYWFFRRFGIAEQSLGVLFFAVHILNAVSHLGAAWLARRIGLVNTMVFTHLPSSVFLIAVPLAPNPQVAIALFLLRESLVQMDVPTRQSYVAAVVQPHERTYASGVTNLIRNVAWAAASSVAGAFMQHVAFSAPLVLGGSCKIAYDVLLYGAFRQVKPPEELEAGVQGPERNRRGRRGS